MTVHKLCAQGCIFCALKKMPLLHENLLPPPSAALFSSGIHLLFGEMAAFISLLLRALCNTF